MRASIGKRFVNAQLREQNLSRRGGIIAVPLFIRKRPTGA
jgi:hypothetical protein